MTDIKAAVAGTAAGTARRWWILAGICLAQLMDVLDVTIVNIALPSAQRDLGFSAGDRQWIVTAYSLAFGSLLLLSGRICDLAAAAAPTSRSSSETPQSRLEITADVAGDLMAEAAAWRRAEQVVLARP